MSHEKKLVLIGAGNIGKGYLADLFSARGYHLVFLTHRREQAESMRKEGRYPFIRSPTTGGRRNTLSRAMKRIPPPQNGRPA